MTPEQVFQLFQMQQGPSDLVGPDGVANKTLLYGYDCDRRTWHVWQKDGFINRAIYIHGNPSFEDHQCDLTLSASILIPNKRLYADACDYDFCVRLRSIGAHLSFTPVKVGADTISHFEKTGFYGRIS